MDQSYMGLVGGIVGGIIGLTGGVFGTYVSIKNTRTPEEKSLMIKMSLFTWISMILLMGVPLVLSLIGILPKWFPFLGLSIFWCIMTPLIIWTNKKQAELQRDEEMNGD